MFDLRIPGSAVWSEVAGVRSSTDESVPVPAQLSLVRDVEEGARTVNHRAVRRELRHHLHGVPVESVNAQRHAVVKDSIARAQDSLPVAEWSPGQPRSRRQAERIGDPLALESQSVIEREF